MNILDVYQNYRIMPSLQTHMLRVTGVAQIICQKRKENEKIDEHVILSACLLHDMGNIIKFDLQAFPDFLEPEGLEYWQRVQEDFFQKYGRNEHEAAVHIAQELHVSQDVLSCVDAVGFDQTQKNYEQGRLPEMICEYADDRVTPWGVVSLQDRCADLEKRYAQKYPSEEQRERRKIFFEYAQKIETYIFKQVSLSPEEITDRAVNDKIENLKHFVL